MLGLINLANEVTQSLLKSGNSLVCKGQILVSAVARYEPYYNMTHHQKDTKLY